MPSFVFHGHSCFEILSENGNVIIDPFLNDNPSSKIKAEEIVNISAILLTHGHADHLGDALEIALANNAPIIAPYELASYMGTKGAKIHAMHIGGAHTFKWGWLKLTQAIHGSGIISEKEIIYTGNPCGFLLNIENLIIYHAGDTGLFGDMKILNDLLGGRSVDVAMLPIGDNFVMGPEDALTATRWIKPKFIVPMHYNTFPLIKQDVESFKKNVERETVSKVLIMNPGDIINPFI